MAYPPKDPKGYYAILGLTPGADAAEVKPAFRRLAKEWHPDRNPSSEAQRHFQRLNEAYQVLSDAGKRAAYDLEAARAAAGEAERQGERRRARAEQAARHAKEAASAAQRAAKAKSRPNSRAAGSRRHGPTDVGAAVGFMACSVCGRVTAQPRYVVFEEVHGLGLKTERVPIHGVYCSDCAEQEAIRASMATWARGWWAIPLGPIYSIAALIRNMLGGTKPREANAKLLVQQAKAFLGRGEYDVARAIADQAQRYARDADNKKQVEGLLVGLANRAPKRLKNRWPLFGRSFVLQSAPFAALLLLFLAVYTVLPVIRGDGQAAAVATRAPIQDVPIQDTRPRIDTSALYHVTSARTVLRRAPGADSPPVGELERFTTIQPLDAPEGAAWVRIIAPDGVIGFAATDELAAGPGWKAQRGWCAENKGPRPDNGTTPDAAAGGPHRLSVDNQTDRDVLFKLKTIDGGTTASVYVHAGKQAVVEGIGDGSYRMMYASGADYSTPCGLFMTDMEAMAFPKPEILQAPPKANDGLKVGSTLSITLHPIGSGDSPVVAASLKDF